MNDVKLKRRADRDGFPTASYPNQQRFSRDWAMGKYDGVIPGAPEKYKPGNSDKAKTQPKNGGSSDGKDKAAAKPKNAGSSGGTKTAPKTGSGNGKKVK